MHTRICKACRFPTEENTLFYLVVKINTSFLTLSLCVFQLDYKTSYGERMLTTFLFVYPNKSYFFIWVRRNIVQLIYGIATFYSNKNLTTACHGLVFLCLRKKFCMQIMKMELIIIEKHFIFWMQIVCDVKCT